MLNRRESLPREIEASLARLLIQAVQRDDADQPYSIVTTAPGRWLRHVRPEIARIIDVSAMTGSGVWRTPADVLDTVLIKAAGAGWREQQILLDPVSANYRLSRPDALLLSHDGRPLAVVEVKSPGTPLQRSFPRAYEAAQIFGAMFALVTNGEQWYLSETQDRIQNWTTNQDDFPTPVQLGDDHAASSDEAVSSGANDPLRLDVSISLSDSLIGLGYEFATWKDSAVIVDYTLPPSVHLRSDVDEVEMLFPEKLYRRFPRMDWVAAVLVAVTHAPSVQQVAAISMRSLAESASLGPLRKYLNDRLRLGGVVELPADLFAAVHRAAMTMLAFGPRSRDQSKAVAFSLVPGRGDVVDIENQAWARDFLNGLAGRSMSIGFAAEVSDDDPWIATVHRPELRLIEKRLKRLADVAPLGEICEVFQTKVIARGEVSGGHVVVRGRDLAAESITAEALGRFKVDGPILERDRLVAGDLLLQRIGESPGRVAVVGPELEGATAANTVIVVRPRADRAEPVDSVAISHFLRSQAGQTLLSSCRSGGIPTLSLGRLREIPVPVFSAQIARELDTLMRTEQLLRVQADRLESMRLSLFNADSAETLELRLQQIRHKSSALASSLEQAETLQFQLRNLFPLTLAFAYRTLESRSSPTERLREQFRVAENVLAFLGSLTLALIKPGDRFVDSEVPVTKERTPRFDFQTLWGSGISPGHWWHQVIGPGSAALQRYPGNDLAQSLGQLTSKKHKSFRKAIEDLIVAKNDFKHDRSSAEEEEVVSEASKIQVLLDNVMETLVFLIDHPIRLIEEISGIRGSQNRAVVHVLRYVGDHPGLPQETLEYQGLLTKGDLYIEILQDQWDPLYPFITAHLCPSCKTRETYYVDRWAGLGHEALLKSFERGHTRLDRGIGDSLSRLS